MLPAVTAVTIYTVIVTQSRYRNSIHLFQQAFPQLPSPFVRQLVLARVAPTGLRLLVRFLEQEDNVAQIFLAFLQTTHSLG